MKKPFVTGLACAAVLYATVACASPGELWEITSKTEMPGMPFAMPGMTQQVCIPKGNAGDPRRSTADKECQMTDVKQSGNKTTWKVRCNHDGEIMYGSGEQTTTASSYQGTMHLSGKSGGEDVNMTTHYSGKKLGQSCDASQPSKMAAAAQKQNQQAIAQMCDVSGASADQLLATHAQFLDANAPCANKRKAYCSRVRAEAAKNVDAFYYLKHPEQQQFDVAKSCGINMASATKSICKKLNGANYSKLSPYCPKQAKAYRVAMRKKDCEGRSYTGNQSKAEKDKAFKECMSGDDSQYAGDSGSGKSATTTQKLKSALDNPADTAIEGAKKLKGFLGF